jgi:hypothetical protein
MHILYIYLCVHIHGMELEEAIKEAVKVCLNITRYDVQISIHLYICIQISKNIYYNYILVFVYVYAYTWDVV